MTLFAADIHSEPGPTWCATPDAALVADALKVGFGLDRVAVIGRATHGSINSRNYLVRHGEHLLVAKRIAGDPATYGMALGLGLTGMPAPLPVIQPRWVDMADDTGGWWSVLTYSPGRFASATVASRVGDFVADLARHTAAHWPERPPIGDDGLDWVRTLVHDHPGLVGHIDEVAAGIKALRDLPRVLTHIDLHPHNLLMTDGYTLTVLDYDSIRRAPLATALGYAAFKLSRAWIVSLGAPGIEDAPGTAGRVLRALDRDCSAPHIWLGAKAELLRRIAYIAEAEAHGGGPWIIDLSRHLAGLDEIDAMRTDR